MADASLGTAVLRTKLDSSGLKTGLNTAKQETEKFAQDSATAIKGIGTAIGAVAASEGLRRYVNFMRGAAAEAHQATAATALFYKQLQRNNQSASEGAAMVERLADKFGLVNSVVEESATFLLRQGASLHDVERALMTAGASAAAAGFDIETAFNNVSVAVATGNSALLKSSGIVATLGKAEQDYAASLGRTVDALTDQERIQARVNAIYEETRSEIEDVDVLLKGLPKSQANVNKELTTFRTTAGDLALKVIVPINEALAAGLRLFNGLPEPVKQAGIAMTGAAIGATALATGIIAIKTALSGFSALGLLSFGPVGWVALGAMAVAGLAVALAGHPSGSISLADAVGKANTELGKTTDFDTFNTAALGIAKSLTGPVKTAFEGTIEDLWTLVSEAEDAGVALARIAFGAQVAQQLSADSALSDLRRALSSAHGGTGAVSVDGREATAARDVYPKVLDALTSGDFDHAKELLNGVADEWSGTLGDVVTDAARTLIKEIDSGLALVEAATVNRRNAGGGAVPPPPGGKGAAERTIAMILAELDAAGTHAMRQAAFEGTDDAFRDAAQQRVRLINTAISELLSDPHYGLVPDWVLDDLRARREAAALEAGRVGVGVTPGVSFAPAPAAASDMALRADQSRRAVEAAATMNAARAQVADALSGVGAGLDAFVTRARAASDAVVNARWGDTNSELERFQRNAASLTATLKAAADQEEFAAGLTVFSDRQRGVFGRGSQFAVGPVQSDAAVANARVAVREAAENLRVGRGSIEGVEEAIDALTTLTPMSVKEINDLTGSIVQLAQAAAKAAEFEENPGLYGRPFTPTPDPTSGGRSIETVEADLAAAKETMRKAGDEGGRAAAHALVAALEAELKAMTRPFTPVGLEFAQGKGPRALIDGLDPKVWEERRKKEEAAADRFANTVVSAGAAFGDAAIRAFEDGDIVGVIRSGLSGAGSIVGGMDLGSVSFLGGSIGIGSLISGGLGLLGTLFGALGGGGRDAEDRRRREQQQARSVPAITIAFNVQQTNHYQGGPRDVANEQAFGRQADTLFESFYTRVLDPRLSRLERAAGIVGV